ncbi:MAG: hypothetical protein JWM39_244 [Parcubacteria group bacterium]|nr:hypothetical protein [Parcubacteria group bacterium]
MEKKHLKIGLNIVIYIFAAIGIFLVAGYFAVKFGLTNEKGVVDLQRESFLGPAASQAVSNDSNLPWQQTEEWGVIAAALTKDQTALTTAASASGVPARLIAANLVAEQLRLFFTERELYKQFFLPLKILGSQTQFSWGVMGMKEATAIQVENNLKDPTSPYYPGDQYAHLLDFPATTTDITTARFTRMTDQHNHYWSYVYAGLYIKEIEAQWRNAGFPIDSNIAVLSTLYNIGFQHSMPNASPQVGGAEITAGNQTFSFGGLALDFYNSNQLTDIFPK